LDDVAGYICQALPRSTAPPPTGAPAGAATEEAACGASIAAPLPACACATPTPLNMAATVTTAAPLMLRSMLRPFCGVASIASTCLPAATASARAVLSCGGAAREQGDVVRLC